MAEMRLDKFLSGTGLLSRSECRKAVRAGRIAVDGKRAVSSDMKLDPEKATVTLDGQAVAYRPFLYILMNKPEGVVSATEDGGKTVIDLLPAPLQKLGLFPCGRLDKNTVGVMLLTNNGPLAHYLLSPGRHVEKQYLFRAEKAVTPTDVRRLEAGVDIGGYQTAPCKVEMRSDTEGVITLHEGKYHQIKYMLRAVCNKVIFLERIAFAGIAADPSLARGEWRYLRTAEEAALVALAKGAGKAETDSE